MMFLCAFDKLKVGAFAFLGLRPIEETRFGVFQF